VSRYVLAPAARCDLINILAWSEERHGAAARARYGHLIATALRDLARDPHRPGSRELTSKRPGLLVYHVRHSRERARGADGGVRDPRHFILYRTSAQLVTILRVLHDAMDLVRHLPEGPEEDV
jgi:toxin ParE1/3/4